MFITKKHISRRTVLRGAGAVLSLPFLDAMVPAATALAQTAATPKPRFVGCFVPHGMAPGYWVPTTEGALVGELPFNWTPLEPFRNQTVILSGLHSRSAEPPPGVTGADHWVASAFLCANKPKKTAGADVYNGTTIDQLIAQKIGQETLMPSMQLAVEDPGANSSNCGEGYSCAYTNSISWSTPSTPLPMELNPQVTFERMFGDGSTTEERAARREQDRSILDFVGADFARLTRELGPADRVQVDEYLQSVREVERRIETVERLGDAAGLPALERPPGIPETFGEHVKLMYELQWLAFRADLTRVVTFMLGRELNFRTYPEIGVNEGHHGLSHHGDRPEQLEKLARLNTYQTELFAGFLEKLKATPEGEGNLLDHSLLLYGASLSNPNLHAHYDLPITLVGGAGGALAGDRHLVFEPETPMTNLLVSLLDKAGVPVEKLGDSTGRLELLSGI